MNHESTLAHITASFREGADLRLKVALECGPQIASASALIVDCLRAGGKILFCGNGGSAADAQHLAAEFVGRFVLERRGLPAIALTTDTSILTAIGNDYGYDAIFSRQVQALGQKGDVLVGISTSGNSPNVLAAVVEAKKLGMKSIGLAGKDGGALAGCVDVPITVRAKVTARVQECHLAIGHIFCELMEQELFLAGGVS